MTDWWSLTRTQLAQTLKVAPPTIAAAIDDGAPGVRDRGARGKASRIDIREFMPWWVEREVAKRAGATEKSKSPAARETEVDIRLKEVKLAKEIEQLLPKADALFIVRDVFTQVNGAFDSMPRRHGYRVLNLKEMADAVEALTQIADQMRADLRVPERWLPVQDETPDDADAGAVA